MFYLLQLSDSSELSCSVGALQQDLEELKCFNESLRKENHSLREQLNAVKNGNSHTYNQPTLFQTQVVTLSPRFPPLVLGGDGARGRSLRPSCDAEFARALKVFYHSMTSVRGQLQRLRRHRPTVCILVFVRLKQRMLKWLELGRFIHLKVFLSFTL